MIIRLMPPPCDDATQDIVSNWDDVHYRRWVASITVHLADNYAGAPLFTTNVGPQLWAAYMDAFPPDRKAYHTCSACKQFMETYGALVSINDDGNLVPAMWSLGRVPKEYKASVSAMVDILKGDAYADSNQTLCQVTGVHYTTDKVWGKPSTSGWYHYAAMPHSSLLYNKLGKTPEQAMLQKAEEYTLLRQLVNKYSKVSVRKDRKPTPVQKALEGNLSGGMRAQLVWLNELGTKLSGRHSRQRDNLIWLAVATSPHSNMGRVNELLEWYRDL